jgi:hypothetical protein
MIPNNGMPIEVRRVTRRVNYVGQHGPDLLGPVDMAADTAFVAMKEAQKKAKAAAKRAEKKAAALAAKASAPQASAGDPKAVATRKKSAGQRSRSDSSKREAP